MENTKKYESQFLVQYILVQPSQMITEAQIIANFYA